jgi:hypothetical protein
LHTCTIHHSEEIVRIIVDYLKEGLGDSMRILRFIDAADADGETPLILAAGIRNALMCHMLITLGANPNMRNSQGRTAVYVARENGWSEIADWLEKKIGAGAMKVETYADIQFEKQARFGFFKTKEYVQEFCRKYITLVHGRLTWHPLGCPFVAQKLIEDKGMPAKKEQKSLVDTHQRYILKRGIELFPSLFDQKEVPTEEEQAEKHLVVDELLILIESMYNLMKQGYTYPNTESVSQPLFWTPLMCAVAVSDIRTARLMIREGADPNYPNRDGTTAVMLAAQLQDTAMLVELLKFKGDINAVDNQGYSALAYANSLPLPTFMEKDLIETLLDDDLKGVKYMSTADLLKLAHKYDPEDLKNILLHNQEEADPENIENHVLILNLLSQYGLSKMQTSQNLHFHLKTMKWRLSEENKEDNDDITTHTDDQNNSLISDDQSVNEFEKEAKRRFEEEQNRIKKESEEQKKKLEEEGPRCPLCTLQIPCAHFFKVETLMQYLNKQSKQVEENGTIKNGSNTKGIGIVNYKPVKKIKLKDRIQELLEETNLADRNTDRSVLLAKKFQVKETILEEERKKKEEVLRALPEPEEDREEIMDYFGLNNLQEVMLQSNLDDSGFVPGPGQENFVTTTESAAEVTELSSQNQSVGTIKEVEESSNTVNILSVEPTVEPTHAPLSLPLVPILKPTSSTLSLTSTDSLSRENAASRKAKRVKFALPDLEDDRTAEVEGDKDRSADSNNAEKESENPDQSKVAEDIKQNNSESTREKTPPMSAEVKEAILAFQSGFSREKDVAVPNQISGPRRVIMFTKKPVYNTSSPTKKRIKKKQPIIPWKMSLSGWIYIHLAPLEADLIPLETLTISQVIIRSLIFCYLAMIYSIPLLIFTASILQFASSSRYHASRVVEVKFRLIYAC